MSSFAFHTLQRLELHRPADAGPGCPGGERRLRRIQRAGAGWAAAQSDASALYARRQRDTPQPDESLEVHQRKPVRKDWLFLCPTPRLRGGSTVRAARSGSARRDSRAKKSAAGRFSLRPRLEVHQKQRGHPNGCPRWFFIYFRKWSGQIFPF